MKGSIMQSKQKANTIVTTVHDATAGTITYTVMGHQPMVLNLSAIAQANRDRAMIHGFGQRVPDAAAVPTNVEPGTPAEKRARMCAEKDARMRRLVDHYNSGSADWSLKSAGGGTKQPDAGLIIMAMIRAGLATDVDDANAKVARISEKRSIDRAASLRVWGGSDKVLAAIAAIQAERSKVDSDGLLDEIAEETDDDEPSA